jgi:hypothetical protein
MLFLGVAETPERRAVRIIQSIAVIVRFAFAVNVIAIGPHLSHQKYDKAVPIKADT